MKNDNRNDRRTSGPAKGTEKTKATGKANAALWETTATLDVYSSYKGKKRVNEIVDEIVTVLTGVAENGSFPLEGYSLIMLNIESVEARAEDWNDDKV